MTFKKMFFFILLLSACLLRAAPVKPDPDETDRLIRYNRHMGSKYSPKHRLIMLPCSKEIVPELPVGTQVHVTRDSAYYMLALYQSGRPKDVERAGAILEKLYELQNKDFCDPWFGLWSYYEELPLDKTPNPDQNWACFIGLTMAHVLREYKQHLNPEQEQKARQALRNAALSAFRRNPPKEYSNVALMTASMAVLAGEICNEPFLKEYARKLLTDFRDAAIKSNAITEYNSPAYTFVQLEETERILQLAEDPGIRDIAKELHHFIWREIARSFHTATGQMAPPQARSYTEYLPAKYVWIMRQATGIDFPGPRPKIIEWSPVRILPCPEEYLPLFKQNLARIVVRNYWPENGFRAYTWMSRDACMGSCVWESFWSQRRGIGAYWLNPNDPEQPYSFRMTFLLDGSDLASAAVAATQKERRLLGAVFPLTNRGIRENSQDAPANRVIRGQSLAACWTLTGKFARVTPLGDNLFRFVGGNWVMYLQIAPNSGFNGRLRAIAYTNEDGVAKVTAYLYRGRQTDWVFDSDFHLPLVFSMELRRTNERFPGKPIFRYSRINKDIMRVEHAGQVLRYPDHGMRYNRGLDKIPLSAWKENYR